jgi:hypothetical protein
VEGATTPFVLGLSETYHPKWRLRAGGQTVKEHFAVSGYMNGWYIDPAALCAKPNKECVRKSDGTYDMQFGAAFTPQKWFVLARGMSVGTIVGSLGVAVAPMVRRRRK